MTAGALILAGLIGWWLVHLGLRPLRRHRAHRRRHRRRRPRPAGPRREPQAPRWAAWPGPSTSCWAGSRTPSRPATPPRRRCANPKAGCGGSSPTPRTSCAPRSPPSPPTPSCSSGAPSNRPEDLARVMSGHPRGDGPHGPSGRGPAAPRPPGREPPDRARRPSIWSRWRPRPSRRPRPSGPSGHCASRRRRRCMVSGDASRLRQVFDNLLANVRAHTPPGTSATVTISTGGGEAVCQVARRRAGHQRRRRRPALRALLPGRSSRSRASGGRRPRAVHRGRHRGRPRRHRVGRSGASDTAGPSLPVASSRLPPRRAGSAIWLTGRRALRDGCAVDRGAVPESDPQPSAQIRLRMLRPCPSSTLGTATGASSRRRRLDAGRPRSRSSCPSTTRSGSSKPASGACADYLDDAASPVGAAIVIADNGSTDGTWDIAERLSAELDGVRCHPPATRKGRGPALRTAWSASRARRRGLHGRRSVHRPRRPAAPGGAAPVRPLRRRHRVPAGCRAPA